MYIKLTRLRIRNEYTCQCRDNIEANYHKFHIARFQNLWVYTNRDDVADTTIRLCILR